MLVNQPTAKISKYLTLQIAFPFNLKIHRHIYRISQLLRRKYRVTVTNITSKQVNEQQ